MPSPKPLLSSPVLTARRRRLARDCGRSALSRIVHLHRRLSHEQFVTSESLARELEVSSRTIKRDIACLRDELGAPIAWDPGTHLYVHGSLRSAATPAHRRR